MSDAKGQHEPSMEEILASIRRIIAEDNEAPPEAASEGEAKPQPQAVTAAPAEPLALAPKPDDDVLELTEVVQEEPMADVPKAPLEIEPVLQSDALPHDDGAEEDRLISTASAAASVAALSQLVQRPRDRSSELSLGTADRTLEDMIRELVRPMLKGWLDENLPILVERLVRDEIGRLVREAQGR